MLICLTLLKAHGLLPARFLCPWDFPGKNTTVHCHFLLWGDLPHPGIKPASPALTGGFFITEPPGKPHPEYYPLGNNQHLCLGLTSGCKGHSLSIVNDGQGLREFRELWLKCESKSSWGGRRRGGDGSRIGSQGRVTVGPSCLSLNLQVLSEALVPFET